MSPPFHTPPFHTVPITEAHAREMVNWHYEGDAEIYDHPDWATMVEKRWGLTIQEYRERDFVALIDANGVVAGFLRLIDRGEHFDVGLGLRPDLCGRGLGTYAMALLHAEALHRKGPCLLRLKVREGNARAIRCYERSGWECKGLVDEITLLGPGTFVVMERRVL